jgi:hypothetical protein
MPNRTWESLDSGLGRHALAGCGKSIRYGPFPHRSEPFSGPGMGLGAAFAAGFPGFRRYEADSGLGQAVAINFGSLTRL